MEILIFLFSISPQKRAKGLAKLEEAFFLSLSLSPYLPVLDLWILRVNTS